MKCAYLVCLLAFVSAGCGNEMKRASKDKSAAKKGMPTSESDRVADYSLSMANPLAGERKDGERGRTPGAKDASVEQKIIYDAHVSLVVEDFSKTEEEMPKLIKQYDGYSADITIDQTQGSRRTGSWQARIPVERFDAFLDALSKLGIPEHWQQTARDVTEEFIDRKASIANLKRLEKETLEILDDREAKLKDVLEVKRQLAQFRLMIEKEEGRLRYLINRTDFATVTVSAREERNYVPPEAPTYTARINNSWSTSLISLRDFGQDASVAFVYSSPWLVILSVILIPGVYWLRRRRKSGVVARVETNPPA